VFDFLLGGQPSLCCLSFQLGPFDLAAGDESSGVERTETLHSLLSPPCVFLSRATGSARVLQVCFGATQLWHRGHRFFGGVRSGRSPGKEQEESEKRASAFGHSAV
jgi:hypothetical protein